MPLGNIFICITNNRGIVINITTTTTTTTTAKPFIRILVIVTTHVYGVYGSIVVIFIDFWALESKQKISIVSVMFFLQCTRLLVIQKQYYLKSLTIFKANFYQQNLCMEIYQKLFQLLLCLLFPSFLHLIWEVELNYIYITETFGNK